MADMVLSVRNDLTVDCSTGNLDNGIDFDYNFDYTALVSGTWCSLSSLLFLEPCK